MRVHRRRGDRCDLERTGALSIATEPWQAAELEAEARAGDVPGLRYHDRGSIQAEIHSPRFLAGVEEGPEHTVILDPAKLARGLAEAADRRGVTIHEGSRVRSLDRRAGGVRVVLDGAGPVDARRVVIATSAYSGWLRRLIRRSCPSTTTSS